MCLPSERQPLFVGPLFTTRSHFPAARVQRLLRQTVLRAASVEIPLLCDRLLELTEVETSICSLYDLYCFASEKHFRFFSTSRHTRTVKSLQRFLCSARRLRVRAIMQRAAEEKRLTNR